MFPRLQAILSPVTLESAYRLHALPRERRSTRAVMVVAAIFFLVSIPTARATFPTPGTVRSAVLVWLAGVILAAAAWFAIRRVRDPRRFDAIVTAWAASLVVAISATNLMLPVGYTIHAVWDVLVVLAVYATLPMAIPVLVAIAAVITLGDAVFFLGRHVPLNPGETRDVLLAHACAHAVGLVCAFQVRRAHRERYLALREAEAAHTKEQEVRRELDTLTGLLRICSNCKRIHTVAGDWQQLESYIRDHSGAEFSHDICPDCERELYGDSDPPQHDA